MTRALLLAFLALIGFYSFTTQALVDQDLWGHLAFGRATWENGDVLRADPYAYVPTRPWINHEWLSEVIYFLLLSSGGSAALLIFKGLAGALLAVCAGLAALKRGANPLVVGVFSILCVGGMADHVYVRPYVFTYALFAVTIWMLEEIRGGARWPLWTLPPVVCLWANCHAAFVVGLGTIVIYTAASALEGDRRRTPRMLAVLGASLLGTLLNPYGVHYWPFVIEAVTMVRPYITEWQPLPWGQPHFIQAQVAAVLVVLLAASRARWREDGLALALLAITGWMMARHYRHVPLFLTAALAFGPALVTVAARYADSERAARQILAAALVMLAIFLGARAPLIREGLEIPLQRGAASYVFPLRAVEFMRVNQLRGNVLCFFDWGEMLIWEMWPQCKVSFDGRLETVYDKQTIDLNLAFAYGEPPGLALLTDYPTDVVLTTLRSGRLMQDRKGWVEAYKDDYAVLWVRDSLARSTWLAPGALEGPLMPLDTWLQISPWRARLIPDGKKT